MEEDYEDPFLDSEIRYTVKPSITAPLNVYHYRDPQYKMIESTAIRDERCCFKQDSDDENIPTQGFRKIKRKRGSNDRVISKGKPNYVSACPSYSTQYTKTDIQDIGIYYEVDSEDEEFITHLKNMIYIYSKYPESHIDIYSFERCIEDIEEEYYYYLKEHSLLQTTQMIKNDTESCLDSLKSILSSISPSLPSPQSSLFTAIDSLHHISLYKQSNSESTIKESSNISKNESTINLSNNDVIPANITSYYVSNNSPSSDKQNKPTTFIPNTSDSPGNSALYPVIPYSMFKHILLVKHIWKLYTGKKYIFSDMFIKDFYTYWLRRASTLSSLSIYTPPPPDTSRPYIQYIDPYCPPPSMLPAIHLAPILGGGRRPTQTMEDNTIYSLETQLRIIIETHSRVDYIYELTEMIRRREQHKWTLFNIFQAALKIYSENPTESFPSCLLPPQYLPSLSIYKGDKYTTLLTPVGDTSFIQKVMEQYQSLYKRKKRKMKSL
ncbi:hypothetical protein WA158_005098 [Blastocystis sp. Blastoise]